MLSMTGLPRAFRRRAGTVNNQAALNVELTQLHGQLAHAPRLSELHQEAATLFATDPGAARFHLTHAWVYALVAGDDALVASLEDQLRVMGGL